METTVTVTLQGGVATVSLNRPDVRNAFNAEMIADLTSIFGDLGSQAAVRVIVLRGEGRVFSAGADVTWMRDSLEYSREENLADAARMSDMFAAIRDVPKAVIAPVHGAALGGGMGLLAVCDIVVAEEKTIFGFTETKLGIVPAVISRFVLGKIGESWARALYLTGERFGAEIAQRIGLVHWVASESEMDTVIQARVSELLSSAPAAVREAKRLILAARDASDLDLRAATVDSIATIRTSDEGQEGLRAFLEKRPPSWRSGE